MKKFEDPLSTAVFTTTFVVKENKEITYVCHDEDDGAWQFHSDDKWEDYGKVAMVLGLGEIIEIDPTVLEVAGLEYGYVATRQSKQDKWVIRKKLDAESI